MGGVHPITQADIHLLAGGFGLALALIAMSTTPRRVAVYLRVSTDGQTTENQRRDKRPAFDRLLKDAVRRRFDVIAAWSVDRLGRSLQDLVSFLSDIHGYGIDLYLHQQGIDTTTPAGKAMFQMLGVFSEFERAMIRERVNAGLARARANGKRLGRAPHGEEIEAKIKELRAVGMGKLKIGKTLGIGTSVVQRVLMEG